MEDTSLNIFLPLDLGWIAKAAQDWTPEDAGPAFFLILYLWAKGGSTEYDEKKLSAAARVSAKKLKKILSRLNPFFHVENQTITQPYLKALYTEKLRVRRSNSEKASHSARSMWEKKRNESINTKKNLNAPSIASSSASSIASGSVRAFSCIDLNLDLKGEERSNASPVPIVTPDDPEITAAIQAFPKTRETPTGSTEVVIGTNARQLAADFLNLHPGYPLKLAASYTAKTNRRARDFENWILNPPDRDVVLTAYEEKLKREAAERLNGKGFAPADPKKLRNLVNEVKHHAHRARSLSHA